MNDILPPKYDENLTVDSNTDFPKEDNGYPLLTRDELNKITNDAYEHQQQAQTNEIKNELGCWLAEMAAEGSFQLYVTLKYPPSQEIKDFINHLIPLGYYVEWHSGNIFMINWD